MVFFAVWSSLEVLFYHLFYLVGVVACVEDLVGAVGEDVGGEGGDGEGLDGFGLEAAAVAVVVDGGEGVGADGVLPAGSLDVEGDGDDAEAGWGVGVPLYVAAEVPEDLAAGV